VVISSPDHEEEPLVGSATPSPSLVTPATWRCQIGAGSLGSRVKGVANRSRSSAGIIRLIRRETVGHRVGYQEPTILQVLGDQPGRVARDSPQVRGGARSRSFSISARVRKTATPTAIHEFAVRRAVIASIRSP